MCLLHTFASSKQKKQNIMEKRNLKKLSRSEAYSCESALHHLLCRYHKSRDCDPSEELCGYTSVHRVMLSSDDVKALSKLREILFTKLYD